MAEYDGSGYPLAYLLRKTTKAAKTQALRESIAKARHATLTHLFTEMKRRGVAPSFVGTDKDFQEIGAVNAVWPEAKHQLWYVSLRDMYDRRLRGSNLINTSRKATGMRSELWRKDYANRLPKLRAMIPSAPQPMSVCTHSIQHFCRYHILCMRSISL